MNDIFYILRGTGASTILEHSPDGWDETMVTWERSEKYWGVFRSWTIPLRFIKDGAAFLRNEFYTYGMGSSVEIEIQRLNKVTDLYKLAYKGILDFSTWKDTDQYVEVAFKDFGAAKLLKDYGSTEYQAGNGIKIYGGGYSEDVEFHCSTGHLYYGVHLITLAKNIVDQMSGGAVYHPTTPTLFVRSDYLENYEYSALSDQYIICVPGKQFRLGNSREGDFRTSFDDWYKSVNALFNLAVGIETDSETGYDVIRIEPKSYFFGTTGVNIENFGEVRNITISLATKLMFKTLKIGYDAKDYSTMPDDWRQYEPNATSKWLVKNDYTAAELDLVSKYRGDGYGITDIMTTENDGTDQDIFFVQITDDGAIADYIVDIRGEVRQAATPGTEVALRNSLITPRRNLQRFTGEAGVDYKWLGNFFFGDNIADLVCTSADNSILYQETSYDGTNFISEAGSWAVLPHPIFYPILFEVEAAMPADLLEVITANPYGLYEFIYEGYTYRGNIMKIDAKLAGRSSQKILLLMDGSNSATTLIDRINRP